jgi:hypothetical protein
MFGATGQPAQSSLFGSTLGQPATSGFGDNKSMFGSTPTSTAGLGNLCNICPQQFNNNHLHQADLELQLPPLVRQLKIPEVFLENHLALELLLQCLCIFVLSCSYFFTIS